MACWFQCFCLCTLCQCTHSFLCISAEHAWWMVLMLFLSRVSWQSKKAKIADIHADLSKCYLCGELLWVSGPGASSGGLFGAASGGPWYATHRHVYGRLEILALFCWTFFFLKQSCDLSDSSNQLERLCLKSSGGLRSAFQFAGGNLFGASAGGAEQMVLCRFGCKADYSAGYAGQSSGTNLFGAGRCDNHSLQLQLQSLVPHADAHQVRQEVHLLLLVQEQCLVAVILFVPVARHLPILGLEEAEVQPSAPQVEAATGACDSCGLQTQSHFGEVLRLGHCIRCSTTIILEKWWFH